MNTPFELPEEMTIYSAVETRDALLAWITAQGTDSAQALTLCAAKVREVDGAGLQLFASLSHINQPWQLLQPSSTLLEACNTMGLSDWLAQNTALV